MRGLSYPVIVVTPRPQFEASVATTTAGDTVFDGGRGQSCDISP
jgi:hypothetical protein